MPPKRTKQTTNNNNNKGEVPDPAGAPAEASAVGTTTTEKKGRKRRENEASASENTIDNAAASQPPPTKKSASAQTNRTTGIPATLYCFGQNNCGQIGLGEDVQQRKFPALVPGLETKKMIGIACGGMHTVVLEEDGTVWTFGVNDDQALGRTTNEEEDCQKPGRVENLPNNIVQVTAGDSHSAALTSDGKVYAWGCFKNKNGNYGLIVNDGGVMCRTKPELITSNMTENIVKMASGSHHIAMLADDGRVYTCGTNDQGQLGRPEPVARLVTRSMTNANANADAPSKRVFLLQPTKVIIGRNSKISDVWIGEFATLLSTRTNDIYVFGLNNYSQLGVAIANDGDGNCFLFKPTKKTVFRGKTWKQIAGGQHHTLALDENGKVYSIGRSTEGRLGLGAFVNDRDERVEEPRLVNTLENHKCVQIAAGTSTSYAITEDGQLYAWGFGENFQLATGDDIDRHVPTICHGGRKEGELKRITGRVVSATAGGQHVAIAVVSQPEMPNGH